MSDDHLRAYIQRILALKAAREDELSPEELAAIAHELGLTDADLAAGREAAKAHLERGDGFRRHQRWDDAIAEIEQALPLLPGRLDVLESLAQAHAGRWRSKRLNADREAAILLARRCLQLDPSHERAFALMNELDPPQKASRPAYLVLVGTAIITIVGILVLRPWVSSSEPRTLPVAQTQSKVETGESDLPVTLTSSKATGLTLHPRHSRLKRYPESSFYELGALLENQGSTELSKVQLKAELLDKDARVLAAELIQAVDTHMAPVRPGDRHAFSHLFRAQPEMAALRLTVTLRDEVPVRKLQSVPKPVTLGWAIEKPSAFTLTARERSAAITRTTFLKPERLYLKPIYELHNEGGETIRRLKVVLNAYDQAGELLKASSKLAVYGDGLALPPGETRVVSFMESLPATYYRHTLSVLEIE